MVSDTTEVRNRCRFYIKKNVTMETKGEKNGTEDSGRE
jgi:hypothetical protein